MAVHQGGRVPACVELNGADLILRGRRSAPQHFVNSADGQEIRVLASRHEHRTFDLLPQLPQNDVEPDRNRESCADGRVVVKPKPTVGIRYSALRGQVSPLFVGQVS